VDIYNWNSFLIYLQLTNQLTTDNVKKVSEVCLHNTSEMMKLIDRYCETGIEKKDNARRKKKQAKQASKHRPS
jgi:hypothetical protein